MPRATSWSSSLFEIDHQDLQRPRLEQEYRGTLNTAEFQRRIWNFTNIGFGEPEVPETCKGCQFFHGKSYNGQLMVCAVYPEGWSDGECPDKEV